MNDIAEREILVFTEILQLAHELLTSRILAYIYINK